MTDTLLILPTIGANVEKALAALHTATATVDRDMPDVWLVADEFPDDDGMTLHSFESIAQMAEAPCFIDESRTRRGLVPAYRKGFHALARGTYSHLVLLEDNVLTTAGWDVAMRKVLDAHPDFGWVACGQLENAKAPFTSLCSMLTREAALALDGGPDLAFAPCQFDDGDMFMRLMAKGFRPHAVDHKVSHPEARTSREGTEADDWALIEKNRVTFMQRWGIADFPWDRVPVHRGCGSCR